MSLLCIWILKTAGFKYWKNVHSLLSSVIFALLFLLHKWEGTARQAGITGVGQRIQAVSSHTLLTHKCNYLCEHRVQESVVQPALFPSPTGQFSKVKPNKNDYNKAWKTTSKSRPFLVANQTSIPSWGYLGLSYWFWWDFWCWQRVSCNALYIGNMLYFKLIF